jgi:hypothetical protein
MCHIVTYAETVFYSCLEKLILLMINNAKY